jgi:hypothetical protein
MTTTSILSQESNKSFPKEQRVQKEEETKEEWTIEYLVDQLFLNLVKIKGTITDSKGKTMHVRKYYRQAQQLMRWIPLAMQPSNEFVIFDNDLSPRIRKDIESIISTPTTLHYVLTQAVGRIFENLDFEYYHLSVARNLRVRIEP